MIEFDQQQLDKELRRLRKKLGRVERDMDGSKSKEMLKSHKEIGKIYVKQAKSNIKNYHEDTVVKKKGKEYPIVRGQLKKSLGIWRPDRRRTGVVVGPRANSPMRKKVRPQADGWFAHFVEERPKKFGPPDPDTLAKRKRPPQNRGVFNRTKQQVVGKMRNKQLDLYRKTLKKAIR